MLLPPREGAVSRLDIGKISFLHYELESNDLIVSKREEEMEMSPGKSGVWRKLL